MRDKEEQSAVLCCKCHEELAEETTTLNYLGHQFTARLLQCPSCGMVFVPEELVEGKMAQVEQTLEDK